MTCDYDIRKFLECSKGDKLSCIPIIVEIVALSKIKNERGVSWLEEINHEIKNGFLRKGIKNVIRGTTNGYTSEQLRNIMLTTSVYSFNTGVELLEEVIIIEGVLALYESKSTAYIKDFLVSHLGIELEKEAVDIIRNELGEL